MHRESFGYRVDGTIGLEQWSCEMAKLKSRPSQRPTRTCGQSTHVARGHRQVEIELGARIKSGRPK
jgi:hypothetical protein